MCVCVVYVCGVCVCVLVCVCVKGVNWLLFPVNVLALFIFINQAY